MNVPLFRQRKNTCGIIALKMILSYFGKDVDENKIIKAVGGLKSYGVRTVKLAEVAQKLGFTTECLSYNQKLASGKAIIKRPTKKDILKHLKKERPVILNVRSSLFYQRPKLSQAGHFIVITRYKKGLFSYNDPADGKHHRIGEEELQFAWFNEVLDSSAYLLAIWPKIHTSQASK